MSIKRDVKGKGVVIDDVEKLDKDIEAYGEKILLISSSIVSDKGIEYIINKISNTDRKVGAAIVEVGIDAPDHSYGSFVVAPNAYPRDKFVEWKPMLFSCNVATFKELVEAANNDLDIHMKSDFAIEYVYCVWYLNLKLT